MVDLAKDPFKDGDDRVRGKIFADKDGFDRWLVF